jgi:hypothetical protein
MARIKTKLVPATTQNLTKAVINHICINGGYAFRVNNQGIYSQELNRFIRGGGQKGVSDIIAVYKGRVIFYEVKNKLTGDRERPAQVEFKGNVLSAGCSYVIITDFEQSKYSWALFKEFSETNIKGIN